MEIFKPGSSGTRNTWDIGNNVEKSRRHKKLNKQKKTTDQHSNSTRMGALRACTYRLVPYQAFSHPSWDHET